MKRLVDEAISPKLADVLRSMRSEGPSGIPERRRVLIEAMTTAATTPASAHTRTTRRALAWGLPIGLLMLGALTFAVGPSNRSEVQPLDSNRPQLSATSTSTSTPSSAETVTSGVRVEDLPDVAARGTSRVQVPSSARNGAGQGSPSPGANEPTIDDELAAIDLARAALAGTRSSETLSRVAKYRTTFATPHFADEADALEIQALAALGRAEEASRKAERFLVAHPRSLYTQRVRSAANLKANLQD